MNLWDDIVGQTRAVSTLHSAASGADGSSSTLTHAWLVTGPPGSGRSNLAFAFAADLLSPTAGEHDEGAHRQVAARTHADLIVLGTEGVIIPVTAAREAARRASFGPSSSRHRVVIVEDADRMSESAANSLLKAIEEPPEQTIWILCAPSEADVLPTIRSRCRSVMLRVPSADDVARLLSERNGVAPELALTAAREAQSHIGMARRLATDADARSRRAETIDTALRIRSVGTAVLAAEAFMAIATADASSLDVEQLASEEAKFLRQLGIEPGGTVPRQVRGSLTQFRKDQKNREKRGVRDGVDRILVDLMSLFRDALLVAIGVDEQLVNESAREGIAVFAREAGAEGALAVLEDLSIARDRVGSNVPALLAMEAALVTVSTARADG
ncbi:MAG: DNA polymerase III subunit delta' [Agrococcus casei]|uniref:DNA polymerase III subunit delta' n=1 Tax=Agrococcus casei TaxID=343512 RepID=UPI003F998DE6